MNHAGYHIKTESCKNLNSLYVFARRFLLVTVPVFEANGNKLSRSSAGVCTESTRLALSRHIRE